MTIPPTGPFQFEPGGVMEEVHVDNEVALDDLFGDPAEVARATPTRPAARPRPPFVPTKAAPKVTSANLVELARARIAELKLELAAMAGLQAEHDALERLVAAADNTNP